MGQSYSQFFKKARKNKKPAMETEGSASYDYESDLDNIFKHRAIEAAGEDSLLNAFGAGKKNKGKFDKLIGGKKKISRQGKSKSKYKNSSMAFILGSLIVMFSSWLLLYPRILTDFIDFSKITIPDIKFSIFSKSTAKAKSTPDKKNGKNDSKEVSKNTDGHSDSLDKDNNIESVDSLGHLEKLFVRKKELDKREGQLNTLEQELIKQKSEIDKRILNLKRIRERISTQLGDRVKIDSAKIDKLVGVYSSMKPQQAAEIISTLNEDLAVEIIGKMKKKSAAQIMNKLKASKVKKLSEKYAGY